MTDVNLREQELEAFTDEVAAYHQSFGKDFWRLLWAAVAELATGKPVQPERLAALANLPLDRTIAIAREALEWDPAGERLIGLGLTSVETRIVSSWVRSPCGPGARRTPCSSPR